MKVFCASLRTFTKRIGAVLASFATVAAVVLLLIFSKEVSQGIAQGIKICLNTVIPSLFCFIALSGIIMRTKLSDWIFKPVSPLFSKLYGVEKSHVPILILSMVGGYPVGAKLIADEVRRGGMSPEEGRRMLCFCVNSGPAFVVGAVGVPIFHSVKMGFLIYLSHLTASFAVAQIMRRFKRKASGGAPDAIPKQNFAAGIVDGVQSAARSMGVICCFVLLFSAVNTLLVQAGAVEWISRQCGRWVMPKLLSSLIFGVLEVTNGCLSLPSSPAGAAVLLASGLTAFGGICVHLQVKSILSDTGVKMGMFLMTRLLYTAISMGVTALFLRLFPSAVQTFAGGGGIQYQTGTSGIAASVFLLLLCVLLLLNGKKSVMMKKKTP